MTPLVTENFELGVDEKNSPVAFCCFNLPAQDGVAVPDVDGATAGWLPSGLLIQNQS